MVAERNVVSMKQKDKQEVYEAYEQAKKDANASGIDALTRDVRKTGEGAVNGVKEAGDMAVNDIDDDITAGAEKLQKDANDAVKGVKNEAKRDLGVGTRDPRRFDSADKLTENIKQPEKDDDFYVSRKRARYQ